MMVTVANYIVHDLKDDDITFENKTYQAVFTAFTAAVDAGAAIDHAGFLHHTDPEIARCANDLVSTPYELANWGDKKINVSLEYDDLQRTVNRAIIAFKAKRVEQMLDDIQKKLKSETDENDMVILMTRFSELKKLNMAINKQLTRIIVR